MAFSYASMDGSYACEAIPTRELLQKRPFNEESLVPYLYRPFDMRWIYWESEAKLIASKSPDFLPNVFEGNCFIEARKRESISEWTRGTYVTALADNFGNGFSNFFPLCVLGSRAQTLFGGDSSGPKPNLSEKAVANLQGLGFADLNTAAEHLFYHILAVLQTPAYREENAGALRQDWPRIPLPATREALEASAALGRRIAALLDVTQAVKGVTTGKIAPELTTIALITKRGTGVPPRSTGILPVSSTGILPVDQQQEHGQDGLANHGQDAHATHGQDAHATRDGRATHGQDAHATRDGRATHGQDAHATQDARATHGQVLGTPNGDAHATEQINDADDLAVTAGWGNPGRGGITMPAGGDARRRQYAPDERDTPACLGSDTFDIYLNDQVYWRNIPAAVWEYTLGGYQVIKKWLSYREHKMLGRPLRADEARYVTEMARRIAAILLMQEDLDENYKRVSKLGDGAGGRS